MLAQFVLLLQRTGLPYVAIVVDDSRSMTVADRYEQKQAAALSERVREAGFDKLTRWNLARTLLSENEASMLREIQDNYRLRLYYLTGQVPSEQVDAEKIVGEIRQRTPRAKARGWALRSAPCWTICGAARRPRSSSSATASTRRARTWPKRPVMRPAAASLCIRSALATTGRSRTYA